MYDQVGFLDRCHGGHEANTDLGCGLSGDVYAMSIVPLKVDWSFALTFC